MGLGRPASFGTRSTTFHHATWEGQESLYPFTQYIMDILLLLLLLFGIPFLLLIGKLCVKFLMVFC